MKKRNKHLDKEVASLIGSITVGRRGSGKTSPADFMVSGVGNVEAGADIAEGDVKNGENDEGKTMRTLLIFSFLVAVAGCASSTDNLQRATAQSIGGNLSPDRITIANVDRGLSNVSWTADAAGRTYSCSADDMVRRPYCARR